MAYWVFSEFPQVAATALPQFVAMLADKEDLVKGKAALILVKIGPPAVPALVPVLSSTNDIARALAAGALGDIGTNAAYLSPRLEAMLNDKVISVRLNAAITLGKLGGKPETFVPVILRCAHEGDEDTRLYALDSLGKFKDRAQSAVPDLTNSLAIVTNNIDRCSLLDALREIDPKQAARFDPPRLVGTSTSPPEESPGPE
jgi:HEAT repeat protein